MTAAFAAVWLGLASGAAPVPAEPLVPPLELQGGYDRDTPTGPLVASPWMDEDQPEPAAEDAGGEAAARFIQSETQGDLRPMPTVATAAQLQGRRHHRSPPLALMLTLVTAIPTAFFGPSTGHLYAGDWKHFWITGGARLVDLTALYILEKFVPGFGIGPLYAVANFTNPLAIFDPTNFTHAIRGYPLGFPVDLTLVLFIVASTVYDAIDSWGAAKRFNERFDPPEAMVSPAAAAVPPKSGP
jgi:hypothetical protein